MSWYDIDPNDTAALYRNWEAQNATKPSPWDAPAPAPAPAPVAPWSPSAPSPIPAIPTGPTQANRDAFARIKEVLALYGLGSLADFVWTQVVEGHSEAEIVQGLRERPEYASRFPGMEVRRKAGLPPISAGEYVSWEERATALMREAGFPKGFWDSSDDFTQLIGQNVSIEQLANRVKGGFSRVAAAAPEVRAAFAQYFGADGDTALAAFFLDPSRAQPFLEQAVTSAEVGGVGRRFGFRFGAGRATQLAQAGVDAAAAARGFAGIKERSALFEENFFDTEDLTAEGAGIDAAFGLSPDAASALERRLAQRGAAFKGGGGAVATSGGITGLGAAT